MLLSMESALRTVFTIYGVFWVSVITIVFFGVGALARHRARLLEQRKHDGH